MTSVEVKKRTDQQVEIKTPSFIEELGDLSEHKKIKLDFLVQLGYELGERQIPLGPRPHQYAIIETIDGQSKKKASFTTLYSVRTREIIILRADFDFYMRKYTTFVRNADLAARASL